MNDVTGSPKVVGERKESIGLTLRVMKEERLGHGGRAYPLASRFYHACVTGSTSEATVPPDVMAWVGEHVDLARALRLFHERPWGTVWHAPARDCAFVWLKICEPVQAFEPQLTASLASRWPSLLPQVLAHDGARGWLLLADAGERLGFGVGPAPWLSLLPAYADLQCGEAAYAADHLEAGVPDRRLARFPELYDEMLAHELPLTHAERARLHEFASRFGRLCDELASAGFPETVQHDDLHGNNVYPNGAGRILDWGDACVSHPFLTLFVAFLHLEEREGLERDDPWLARLRDVYLERWGRSADLRESFELAQRLGPFAKLFTELRVLDAVAESERHSVTGLPAVLARCITIAS
jgi:hypothetical protein